MTDRVIPFPSNPEPPTRMEQCLVVMEEHVATLEKAALVFVHSVERLRTLLEEAKAASGYTWQVPAPQAVFGDAVLFGECEVRLMPRIPPQGAIAALPLLPVALP